MTAPDPLLDAATEAAESDTTTGRWHPGDRVLVSPTGRENDWVPGTVENITARGVLVRLDQMVSGIDHCTATPGELVGVHNDRSEAPNG